MASFEHCLAILREDIPRLRWRYNGARQLIYTPEHHGEPFSLPIDWHSLDNSNALEYKVERNIMQMIFGREQIPSAALLGRMI